MFILITNLYLFLQLTDDGLEPKPILTFFYNILISKFYLWLIFSPFMLV